MPLHHAVLALLSNSPSYGYELKTQFERAVGPQWGELNIGHLYQVLERLTRDRFVTKREVAQADRPDKTIYRITKAGREELTRWLDDPYRRHSGYRDDFFLKLFAAAEVGGDALGEVIQSQRAAWLGELKALRELRSQQSKEPLVKLLISAAIFHTEANLRLIEEAEAAQRELAAPAKKGDVAAEADRTDRSA